MKLMKTEEAVGQILCHDISQIIKGVTKDAVFCKGHLVCSGWWRYPSMCSRSTGLFSWQN